MPGDGLSGPSGSRQHSEQHSRSLPLSPIAVLHCNSLSQRYLPFFYHLQSISSLSLSALGHFPFPLPKGAQRGPLPRSPFKLSPPISSAASSALPATSTATCLLRAHEALRQSRCTPVHAHARVSTHLHTPTCKHTHVCARTPSLTPMSTHVHLYACTHLCKKTHPGSNTSLHALTNPYACTPLQAHPCIHVHVRAHTSMCMHTRGQPCSFAHLSATQPIHTSMLTCTRITTPLHSHMQTATHIHEHTCTSTLLHTRVQSSPRTHPFRCPPVQPRPCTNPCADIAAPSLQTPLCMHTYVRDRLCTHMCEHRP